MMPLPNPPAVVATTREVENGGDCQNPQPIDAKGGFNHLEIGVTDCTDEEITW